MKKLLKIVTLILYAFLILAAIYQARHLTLDAIVTYTPSNKLLAALFLLALFAIKSISIFFPIIVLQIASGFLFPTPIALIINLVGTAIGFILPYFLGKYAGSSTAEKAILKREKIRKIIDKQRKHEFFLTFFLRVISCLPSDLVSMYLGTLRFDFKKYIVSSMLGALPGIIPATFMGQSITKPNSPEFMIAVSITVICSLLSMVWYHVYTKRTIK